MSSSETAPTTAELAARMTEVAAELRVLAEHGRAEDVPEDAVQALLGAAVKVYVAKREAGAEFSPFADGSVTATDVVVTATSMIKAADLQLFELSLWNGFGNL